MIDWVGRIIIIPGWFLLRQDLSKKCSTKTVVDRCAWYASPDKKEWCGFPERKQFSLFTECCHGPGMINFFLMSCRLKNDTTHTNTYQACALACAGRGARRRQTNSCKKESEKPSTLWRKMSSLLVDFFWNSNWASSLIFFPTQI